MTYRSSSLRFLLLMHHRPAFVTRISKSFMLMIKFVTHAVYATLLCDMKYDRKCWIIQ